MPAIAFVFLAGTALRAQSVPLGEARQVVDSLYEPARRGPLAFAPGRGPRVVIDEAHRNFHTAAGRYRPFARLLEADGFRVGALRASLDSASLASVDVLVIANALGAGHERGGADWRLPAVAAFTPREVDAVVAWVRRGGALLLVADHMPFAGDAAALAAPFGVHFLNGFALLGTPDPRTGDYPIVFRRRDGTLGAHAATAGATAEMRVDSVASFTGSAFRVTGAATPLLVLPPGTRVLLPAEAWQFSATTAEVAGDGLLQGAALAFGRGRVAVFGEAAMFTAQRKGVDRAPMGMNAPAASQNAQLVRNVVRWLATP